MSETLTPADWTAATLQEAAQGDFDTVEAGWLDTLDNTSTDPQFYRALAKHFAAGDAKDRFLALLNLAVEALEKREAWADIDKIVAALLARHGSAPLLREIAARAARGRYSRFPMVDAMVARSGLEGDIPLDKALGRFRALLRKTPGQVYQHPSWGDGVVTDFDPVEGSVVLDFPKQPGKSMTLEGLQKYTQYLAPSHFRAKRARFPDKLREQAKDDPAALVKLALKSSGGALTQGELKTLIVGPIMETKKWTSWWGRVRKELRFDPLVEIEASGGARAQIRLRDEPRTLGEELDEIFGSPESTLRDRAIALGHVAEAKKAPDLPVDLLRRILAGLEDEWKKAAHDDFSGRLGLAMLAEDLRQLHEDLDKSVGAIPEATELLEGIAAYEFLLELEHTDHALRIFEILLNRDGADAAERSVRLLRRAEVRLAQAIWRSLDPELHRGPAAEVILELLDAPLENPDTFLWAVKMILDGQWDHLRDYFSTGGIVMDLIAELEDWNELDAERDGKDQAAAGRQLVTRVKSILSARHYAALCNAVEEMSLDQAERLRRLIDKSEALHAGFRTAALRQLLLTRKDLDDTGEFTSTTPGAEEEEILFCTALAREEKLAELSELTLVKIPKNTRELDEARQEGDLKENAGYHAAKDTAKILQQKKVGLSMMLAQTVVVEAETIRTEAIGFGSTIEIENMREKKTERFTILGRWEADPEHNVLSIHAPLAEQLIGHVPGDEFEVTHPGGGSTPYRVISIKNALASGQWAARGATPEPEDVN